MYTTKSGETINLGSEIAKGGEGVVYNIQNDDENCSLLRYRVTTSAPMSRLLKLGAIC